VPTVPESSGRIFRLAKRGGIMPPTLLDSGDKLMKKFLLAAFVPIVAGLAAISQGSKTPPSDWKMTAQSQEIVKDEKLASQIYKALDAARDAGTDPSISKFRVRAATVFEYGGQERQVVGGNSEYEFPEAIHAETSLFNHVTCLYGPQATRGAVRFIAFYSQRCGDSLSCGDCRDYQVAATDFRKLLVVCGQESDHTVHVRRFSDAIVDEEDFPEVTAQQIPLEPKQLEELVDAATDALRGGVTLFTSEQRAAAAGISFSGKIYRAAGSDDAAFHYRYPIGGLLQQAATSRDYLIRAIVVAGESGKWPKVSYRDRQYGYESSSFNQLSGKEPIFLILSDGQGRFRMTTFEKALPHAFSTKSFMPDAVRKFLDSHQP
jgi:cytidine deaminase